MKEEKKTNFVFNVYVDSEKYSELVQLFPIYETRIIKKIYNREYPILGTPLFCAF